MMMLIYFVYIKNLHLLIYFSLKDKVNLIVTSDHGMASVNTSDPERVCLAGGFIRDLLKI